MIGTLLLMGCANRAHFPAEAPSGKIIEHNKVFFFWGLFGSANFELYEDCPASGVYEVYTYTSPSQVVLNVVTLGVLSPRTIQITCSGQEKVDPFKTPDSIAKDMDKKISPFAQSNNMKKDVAPMKKAVPVVTSKAIFDDAKRAPRNSDYTISKPSPTSKSVFNESNKASPTPRRKRIPLSQKPTIFERN